MKAERAIAHAFFYALCASSSRKPSEPAVRCPSLDSLRPHLIDDSHELSRARLLYFNDEDGVQVRGESASALAVTSHSAQ